MKSTGRGTRPTTRTGVAGATLLAVVVALLGWWLSSGARTDDSADLDRSATSVSTTESGGSGQTATGVDPASGLPWISVAALPTQARDTLEAIAAGGPYPYDRDGVTFENREGLLPDHERGYYHEYTVETPGSDDRGARRVIAGASHELYYTGDHYASFSRVAQ